MTTEKFQHWLLNDEGARIATPMISAISSRGTDCRESRGSSGRRRRVIRFGFSHAAILVEFRRPPDFDQRLRQLAHHRFVMRRAGREARAFGAARHGRKLIGCT